MIKVLLIYEDYAEGSRTQAYLKKVGFDVHIQNHDQRLFDLVISFHPDVIVVNARQKFSSLDVGIKLKNINSLKSKTILVLPQGARPDPTELVKARVDVLIESPVKAERLIQVLAKLTNIEAAPFLEKLKKAILSDPSLNEVSGGSKPHAASEVERPTQIHGELHQIDEVSITDRARMEKYQKFIQDVRIDKAQTSHSRQEIKLRQAELKKSWDFDLLDEIDKLKRQFVKALFKKTD